VLTLLAFVGFCHEPTESRAAEPTAPARATHPATARQRILLGVLGRLGTREREALRDLLEPELRRARLSLSLEAAEQPLSRFIEVGTADASALLVALLDLRNHDRVELYIVDPARSRAVMRRLPGTFDSNPATLEAIASIVLAATAALSEGLEVASQSVEEVVPASSAHPAPDSGVHASGALDGAAGTSPRTGAAVETGLGVAAASFAQTAPISVGPSLMLGVTFASQFGAQLSASYFLPSTVETSFGRFNLQRVALEASVGYRLGAEPLTVTPELGVIQEFFGRTETEPQPSVEALDEAWSYRTGALAGGRARYRVASRVQLALSVASAFFPARARIVAAGSSTEELLTPFRWVALAHLGAQIDGW
jgi:hypothetical protein